MILYDFDVFESCDLAALRPYGFGALRPCGVVALRLCCQVSDLPSTPKRVFPLSFRMDTHPLCMRPPLPR